MTNEKKVKEILAKVQKIQADNGYRAIIETWHEDGTLAFRAEVWHPTRDGGVITYTLLYISAKMETDEIERRWADFINDCGYEPQ